jgi:ribosomal RNA assembly protein
MTENIIHTRIPHERLGVLIGSSGNAKRIIENKFDVNIEVDSETGDVEIRSKKKLLDPIKLLRARDIIIAIGRGFSSERAFRLFNNEENLGIIDLRGIFKSQSDIQRIKGRIIGKNGKTRRLIEELTGADISIYGHTVSIIGEFKQFEVAKEAIEMLIKGKLHKSVYGFLQRKRFDLKKEDIELWKPSLPI